MTDKSLRHFSVFVSLPVKCFTLELMSYVAGSIIVYITILYYFLSYPACKYYYYYYYYYYIFNCGLSGCTIFLHILS